MDINHVSHPGWKFIIGDDWNPLISSHFNFHGRTVDAFRNPANHLTSMKPTKFQLDVSENSGTPKSSILLGFSIINRPFGGFSPYCWKHPGWPDFFPSPSPPARQWRSTTPGEHRTLRLFDRGGRGQVLGEKRKKCLCFFSLRVYMLCKQDVYYVYIQYICIYVLNLWYINIV